MHSLTLEEIISTAEAATPPHAKILYDGRAFFVPGKRGELVPMNEGSVRRYLVEQGYTKDKKLDEISPALTEIQIANFVLRIAPLAGHASGWHDMPEGRIYVTKGPRPVQPADVPFGMIDRLLREMLGEEQYGWFLRWLAIGWRSLVSGGYRPGQAVAMVGPKNCGKSLVSGLVTEMYGGRSAHPYQTWSKGTSFNYHLAAAETLTIDDETPSRNMQSRKNLATAIKSNLFADTAQIERKFGDPFTARPWWRLLICCNSEPENVMVLPPMGDDIDDKIAFLLVSRPRFPSGLESDETRQAFRRRISQELPGLLHHALRLPIAPFAVNDRTGIETYHNTEVLDMLRALTKEAMLEQLILLAKDEFGPSWTGTTSDFWHKITTEGFQTVREDARKLMDSPLAASYLLRDLAKSRPKLITSSTGHANLAKWVITLPDG